jgi:putative tricarboxylic transport membrane protein
VSERFFLVFLFTCGAVYLYFGLRIEVPFTYEPLGPRTFPVLLGCCLAALSILAMIIYPMAKVVMKGGVAKLALAVLFYLLFFQLLGFMLATTISTYAIARLVGSSWMQGLLTGLLLAIAFYGIFHFLLGVPLPLGALFRLGG